MYMAHNSDETAHDLYNYDFVSIVLHNLYFENNFDYFPESNYCLLLKLDTCIHNL